MHSGCCALKRAYCRMAGVSRGSRAGVAPPADRETLRVGVVFAAPADGLAGLDVPDDAVLMSLHCTASQKCDAHGSCSVGVSGGRLPGHANVRELERGADEARTHNLLNAIQALSQLSYCPDELSSESYLIWRRRASPRQALRQNFNIRAWLIANPVQVNRTGFAADWLDRHTVSPTD